MYIHTQNSGGTTMVVMITIAVLAIIAWISFSGNQVQDLNLLVSEQDNLSSTERVILENLNKLQSIEIKDSLFQNPAFGQLQDFSRNIVKEPQGRDNPFDKVNIDAINKAIEESSNTSSTTLTSP